jgi:hypothetical protein
MTSIERKVTRATSSFDPTEVISSDSIKLWREKMPRHIPKMVKEHFRSEGYQGNYFRMPERGKNMSGFRHYDYSLCGKILDLIIMRNSSQQFGSD